MKRPAAKLLNEIRLFLGLERNTTSHGEKLLSALGALLGIVAVYLVSCWCLGFAPLTSAAGVLMVTSMGASAVLLFAVPQGALSQPWALAGGHLVSGFIGVACFQGLGDHPLAGPLAVGLAVGAMHYLRCIHPPGGATALTAVIGGEEIHGLGFEFLLSPLLINVLAIFAMAVAFNALFAWRRYPAHLARRHKPATEARAADRQFELTQEDFAAAMQQLDSYVDVTAEGLSELLELAKQHAEKNITHPEHILAGRFYSNGKLGAHWSVRQVLDAEENTNKDNDKIIYKTLAGAGAYDTGLCRRDEFRQWARFEVVPQQGRWVKQEDVAE